MIKPSKNAITGEYTANHKALDFSHKGDSGVYATESGQIIQSVNLYNKSWTAKSPLKTSDYGNYIKMRHDDGTFSLYTHMKKDSILEAGSHVNKGDRIGTIGNTGNSTGPHLHFEYRNADNINIEPKFEKEGIMPDDLMQISKGDFKRLMDGSERSEAVHKELGLEGDHVTTPIADFIQAIKTLRGYQADATTMRRKLSEAETEVLNRGELISRLEEQLSELKKLKDSESSIHSAAVKAAAKLETEYRLRLESMQAELDSVYKQKGTLQKQVAVLESDNKNLKNKNTTSIVSKIILIIKRYIERYI